MPLRRVDDPPQRRRLRKGMYLLPSLFTTANIAAGYYSISQSTQGSAADFWHFDNAAIAIGVAMVFDMLDGRIARLTRTESAFGKELDSLADIVTFGVAPAVLAWAWGFRMPPNFAGAELGSRLVHAGAVITFVFLIACASRLARFNIQHNPQPSNPGRADRKYFVGMPTTAAAGIVAAGVHFSLGVPLSTWWLTTIWAAFVASLAFLMVSTWRFYSFKDVNLHQRHPFYLIVVLGVLIYAIMFFSQYVLFFLGLTYMLSGVFARLAYALRRRTTPPSPPPVYKEALQ